MPNLMIITIFPAVTLAPPPLIALQAVWGRDLALRTGFWGVPCRVTLIRIFATGIQSQA